MGDEARKSEVRDEGMGRREFLLLAAGAAAVGAGVLVLKRSLPVESGVAATEEVEVGVGTEARAVVAGTQAASGPATEAAEGLATGPASGPAMGQATGPEGGPATGAGREAATETGVAPDMPHVMFPDAAGRAIASVEDSPVIMIARSHWTSEKPNLAQIVLMGGFERITVHHSGFATAWEADTWKPTETEIQAIRAFHAGSGPTDRHWADIAYHFIVDRAGRVWQARPLVYQGAHVQGNNVHNIGIVLLGNFDLQRGSAAQLTSLCAFIGFLRRIYKIGAEKVYTHGELGKTDCPGTSLRAFVARMRAEWVAEAREG